LTVSSGIRLRNMEDPAGIFHVYQISKDIRKKKYSALVGLKREWPIINEKITARSLSELEEKAEQAYHRLEKQWREYQNVNPSCRP